MGNAFPEETPDIKLKQLNIEKITLENKKLKDEIKILNSNYEELTKLAPFLTSIVALIGVFITIWKHITETSRLRKIDKEQLEAEKQRQFDDKFNNIIECIGSSNVSVKAGAVISLQTFLKAEYNEFHNQVYSVIAANLKLDNDGVTQGLLVNLFEKAIGIESIRVGSVNSKIPDENKQEKISIDLSGINIKNAILINLNLSWSNFRYAILISTNLKDSILMRINAENSDLRNAQWIHVDMEKAILNNANLQNACLANSNLQWCHFKKVFARRTQFQQAKLQSTLFNGADLKGASFEQADINNAVFKKAIFDNRALRSIVKSFNWRKAHFDNDVLEQLEQIESRIISSKKNSEGNIKGTP